MYGGEVEMHNCKEVSRRLESMHETTVTMFHGEIWNILEIRYLFD